MSEVSARIQKMRVNWNDWGWEGLETEFLTEEGLLVAVIQPEIVPELRNNVIFLSILLLYIFDKTTDNMLKKTKMLICLVLRNFFKICCRNFFSRNGLSYHPVCKFQW